MTDETRGTFESVTFVEINPKFLLDCLKVIDREIVNIRDHKVKTALEEQMKIFRVGVENLHGQLKHNHDNYLAFIEMMKALREQITRMREELEALIRPPMSYGYVVRVWPSEKMADIYVGNDRRKVAVSPGIDFDQLKIGRRVLLSSDTLAVLVVDEEWEKTGTEGRVSAIIDGNVARVTTHLDETIDVILAEELRDIQIREGDDLLVSGRFAFKKLPKVKEVERLFLAEVPTVTYDQIGGLDEKIDRVRELIEWPYLYREQYLKQHLKVPKGILLYGPPGCGKTLIAKAVANGLGQKTPGGRSYFMNIKGPELLNKWVGETERLIREVFSRAKELATEKIPVVIFFDEFDSLFPIRGSQISTDTAGTTVPQFTTEMDGIEGLTNVIVIGATNRQDRIDPAVIRPGRFDDKIEIGRPDKAGCLRIFNIYLNHHNTVLHPQYFDHRNYEGSYYVPTDRDGRPRVSESGDIKKYPLAKDPAYITSYLTNMALDRIFDPKKELNQIVRIRFANGSDRTLYSSDFISGAVIESIVNRAKRIAFSEFISSGCKEEAEGLKLVHLMLAVEEEFENQGKMPSAASPNEWASILGINERIIEIVPLTEERKSKQKSQPTERVTTGQYL